MVFLFAAADQRLVYKTYGTIALCATRTYLTEGCANKDENRLDSVNDLYARTHRPIKRSPTAMPIPHARHSKIPVPQPLFSAASARNPLSSQCRRYLDASGTSAPQPCQRIPNRVNPSATKYPLVRGASRSCEPSKRALENRNFRAGGRSKRGKPGHWAFALAARRMDGLER